MSLSNKEVVNWFVSRIGKLTYSMSGSRNGTDGTADCSGSITQAIRDAGGSPYAYLYSTVTLESYLIENGYKRISVNQEWDAKEGDVVLMSWGYDMATSGGAGGHVGVMMNDTDFISVDYWTGGQIGTAVTEHDFNYYYNVNPPNYFEVWRSENEYDSNENNIIQTKGREATMHCLYERPINPKNGKLEIDGTATAVMFCNGANCRRLYDPDEIKVIQDVYRDNNGKEIPFYTKDRWNKKNPWFVRLEAVCPVLS